MGWRLSQKPKTQQATKALLDEFLNMDVLPRERPLSERRLQVYERILKAGEFRPVTWAFADCKETGARYRLNGQHTTRLLSGIQGKLPEFYVTVEGYECDTLDDVAKLYATFDSRLGVRTTSDINQSFASTMPELSEVPKAIINLAVSGMSFYKWEEGLTGHQAAERAELLLDNGEFILWLMEVLLKPGYTFESKHLLRSPVTAAMFGSFQKSKQAASDFWIAVRDESGAHRQEPDRVLARFLIRFSVNTGQGGKPGRPRSAPREMYVKCIHGWNAWRKKIPTELKYYAGAETPKFS